MKDFETGLTFEEVHRRFRYVKSTGLLLRRIPVLTNTGGLMYPIGSAAGSKHHDGYLYTAIDGRLYLVHRLATLLVDGIWPRNQVDHRNGVRDDNVWKNLRHATVGENRRNSLGQKCRKGPYPGVHEVRKVSKVYFAAQIKKDGVVYYLGSYPTAELARNARVVAELKMFKAFSGSLSRGRI